MIKKQIKLTVTDEMYNAIRERAEKMSLSIPALCCYYIGEKLYQTDLAENISIDALKDMFGKISPENLLPENKKEWMRSVGKLNTFIQ